MMHGTTHMYNESIKDYVVNQKLCDAMRQCYAKL